MKRLLDQLISHVWPVIVARIDMVHARSNGLAQNCNGAGHIARRAPDHLLALAPRKLHCAITHAVQSGGTVSKGKCAAEIQLFRHLSPHNSRISQLLIGRVPHPSERSAAESKNLLLDPLRKEI